MNGVVPPFAVTVAEPLLLPQAALVDEVESAMAFGCVIVTDAVLVHELASVTVTE